jgi:uncharacterized MAPEG superfamily protein
MTIALWCVLISGLLPPLCALLAKSDRKTFDNHQPREWLARQHGWRARAHAAQQNSWEAFAFFSACVFAAHLAGAPQSRIDLLAVAYIAVRLVYILCYVTDKAALRSAVWSVGLGLALAIFLSGV